MAELPPIGDVLRDAVRKLVAPEINGLTMTAWDDGVIVGLETATGAIRTAAGNPSISFEDRDRSVLFAMAEALDDMTKMFRDTIAVIDSATEVPGARP